MSPWPFVKLGSLADFKNGLNFSSQNWGRGLKVIGVTDFQDYSYPRYDEVAEINPSGVVREADYLEEGDVLFVRSNGNPNLIGRTLFIKGLPEKMSHSGFTIRLRFKTDKVFRPFYVYLFKSCLIRAVLSIYGGGTNINNLNQQILANLDVPAPPFATQQKIAALLSAYDELIENNRRRIALLDNLAEDIYREWFVRLRFPGHEHTPITKGVPEGWEKIYLGDVVETQYGYTETASDEPIGPKFLRGTDINKMPFIDWSTVPYCPIDEIQQRKYQLRVGDILIIRMADPGKVAIVEREIEAVFASYLIRLVPIDARLTPYYLFYCLSDDKYQDFIAGVSTGATRKTASAPLLVDFHLLLPTEPLIRAFEDAVRPLRQQITILLVQNEKLRAARNLLLPRLMNGEISV